MNHLTVWCLQVVHKNNFNEVVWTRYLCGGHCCKHKLFIQAEGFFHPKRVHLWLRKYNDNVNRYQKNYTSTLFSTAYFNDVFEQGAINPTFYWKYIFNHIKVQVWMKCLVWRDTMSESYYLILWTISRKCNPTCHVRLCSRRLRL